MRPTMFPTAYSPEIPGVTSARSGTDKAVPPLLKALEKTEEGGTPRDDAARADALCGVAKCWYDAHKWYYREATECLAFYGGSQWGVWSTPQSRWIARPEPRHNDLVRLVCNGIKPVTDMAVALLTQESPIFGCAAAKDEVRDTAAAEAGDAILEYYWREKRYVEVYRDSARDAFITGTSPILVEWDSDAGESVETGGISIVPDETSPIGVRLEKERKSLGDIRLRQLPREAIAFEPGAETDQDGIAVCVRERVLRSTLRDQFPDKIDKVPEKDGGSEDDDVRHGRAADRASPVGGTSLAERHEAKIVDVYTFYLRKCPKYPLGWMVKFCEGAILYEGENPIYPKRGVEPDALWPRANWPIFFVKCDNRSQEPWGRGRVVDMLQPQRALNGTVSKTVQHMATISNTKVMLPKGLEVEWSDEIGQVIRFGRMVTPGQIGYLNPPAMPQEFIVAWDKFKAELEYAAGINSSTMGTSPTSDASGRMVQLLQQKDTGRIAPVKRSIDSTWAEIMRYALFLFRRHADQKRKILVVGENKDIAVRFFDGSDLAASIDVLTFNDQSIPRDPSQKMLWLQQFTSTLMSVPDPGVRKMIMRLARVKDFESYLSDLDPSESKAQRMIHQVISGQPVYIWPGDDAMTMAVEIDRFTSTREYERIVTREKGETNGWSLTEAYLSQLYAYYKTASSQPMSVAPPGFMQPPANPAAPPPMMAMPPAPPIGAAAPQPPAGAPMPDEVAPPAIPVEPSASTPLPPVGI